ncbi:small, acid-soluble spore protein, H family [Inediibacterium massiliense]|uniref:small, acid-soluble spore protein, H family n=1 Tax=Inediibacterium massiliense TaxID=1658111 RepID=UPI0006B5A2F7|nr:small, acid-soluble spore protein, H family [Inediibacterium massiliense]
MIKKRAEEILNGNDHIEVLYKGNSVWLTNMNSNQMMDVKVLENNKNITVPISDLQETGRELK